MKEVLRHQVFNKGLEFERVAREICHFGISIWLLIKFLEHSFHCCGNYRNLLSSLFILKRLPSYSR